MVEVETAGHDPAEEAVAEVLKGLLRAYDTSRWEFTHLVIVKKSVVSHSHPVLTIGTKVNVPGPLGLLSTYVHEQLHWYADEREAATLAAVADLRSLYPTVPDRDAGGASDARSTYLHLVVNWLELESLRLLVGRKRADETLRQAVQGPVYRWVYQKVFVDHHIIGQVLSRHNLDSLVTG